MKVDKGYDVSIMMYDTVKGRVSNINFYKDIEQLIDSNRVRLMVKDNRLYFVPCCYKKKGTFKLANHTLQVATKDIVAYLEYFSGNYQLEFDTVKDMYYIENAELMDMIKVQNDIKDKPVEVKKPQVVIKKYIRNTVAEVPKEEPKEVVVAEDKKPKNNPQKESIFTMLDVMNTYDKNEIVYNSLHDLIKVIRDMVVQL